MSEESITLAPAATRLGQLQRGRGIGFRAVVAVGSRAHDDLLQCLVTDPRIGGADEQRERYYAELLVAIDLPLAPLAAAMTGRDAGLAHAALAGAWRLGHLPTRALLADDRTDDALVAGVSQQLFGFSWARLVALPRRAAKAFLREALLDADCVRAQRRVDQQPMLPGEMSVDDLLELGRRMRKGQRWAVIEELCRRGTEADREALFDAVRNDSVLARVQLAASALGTLGDERLLAMAVEYFAREDVFEDASRRLSGADRMRRSALSDYVRHLPADRQLELARAWHGRGGYFETVAGNVFGDRATPDDRERIESFVAEHSTIGGDWQILHELEALGRIGDPRSAPLLLQVAEETGCSGARRRAIHALAGMPQAPGVEVALREALWDSEAQAVVDACRAVPSVDGEARARLRALSTHVLVDASLRAGAAERLHADQ